MNSDPLQRRMFAQQIMAQHARANQPMGILASSPQLMGAVQGFKDGGAVKGYQAGGLKVGQSTPLNQIYGSNIPAPDFSGPLYKGIGGQRRKEQEIARIKQTELEKLKQSGFDDVGPTISIEDAKKAPSFYEVPEPAVNAQEKKTNEENVIVDDMRDSNVNKENQGTNKYAGTDESGVANLINQKLVNGLATETKEDASLTETSQTTSNDIQTKAAKSVEEWKKKLTKTDKKYEATNKKSEVMYNEVKKVLEETDEDIDLDGIERIAKKTLGLKDKEAYDEDRLTSFWMAMIKGGLATAAGESSNALTNIAKGLSFGVASYGKDINNINDQEREDRKELAKMKYDLVKDEKTARIAKRTLKLQGYQALATIENRKNEFESTQAYQKERDLIKDELAFANLDLNVAQVFNKIELEGANHDLRVAAFNLDVKKQKQFIEQSNLKLNQDYKLGTMTKEMKNVYSLGTDFVTFDEKTKTYTYTDKGESALLASVASKTQLTDLKTSAKKVAAGKIIEGFKYQSEDAAEKAYYYYVGITKPKIEALTKTEKGITGLKPEIIKKRTAEILADFAKNTGGSNTGGSGGDTSGTIRKQSPTVFDKTPDKATIEKLVAEGFNQIKVGEKIFNID